MTMISRLELRLPPDLLDKIERWRNSQPVPPTKAAAVRYLLEYAVDALTSGSSDQLPIRGRKTA